MTRTVLVDLDGTIYSRGRLIPGAVEAVAALRARGVAMRFLTNIDSRTPAELLVELREWGLEVLPDELFTPVVAAVLYLSRIADPRVYTLVSNSLQPAFERFRGNGLPTHVVVGDCRDVLTYQLLDGAFRAVRAGAELVALQRGRYFLREDGDHLDTGAIVASLEYATGMRARLLGKPSLDFFNLAIASAGVAALDTVVVGDDSTTDIAGGKAANLRTVQVRTGKYADQAREGNLIPADHVIDSIADLPALLGGSGPP